MTSDEETAKRQESKQPATKPPKTPLNPEDLKALETHTKALMQVLDDYCEKLKHLTSKF